MSEEKYCVDCKHYRLGVHFNSMHQCAFGVKRSLITGKGQLRSCDLLRAVGGDCGPTGKNYEPKDDS